MEALLNPRRDFWGGRRVLVVGHTGFKGGWLSLWLHRMGASVTGLSLPPPTEPSLFALAGLDALIQTQICDIRDFPTVAAALARWRPEVVFHLAAQALVRRSYREPIETFSTNVLGTVHVLEAIRATPSVRSTIVVTSDKCYENREWPWAYREIDPVGGDEPYSASKGCAELVAVGVSTGLLPGNRDGARRQCGRRRRLGRGSATAGLRACADSGRTDRDPKPACRSAMAARSGATVRLSAARRTAGRESGPALATPGISAHRGPCAACRLDRIDSRRALG